MSATAPITAPPRTPQPAVKNAAWLLEELPDPLAVADADGEPEPDAEPPPLCGIPSPVDWLAGMLEASGIAVMPVPFVQADGSGPLVEVKVMSAHYAC